MNELTPPLWRLDLLGGLRLSRLDDAGSPVVDRFRTQKTAALLGFLGFKRGPQARDTLCEMFWPGNKLDSQRNNLRVTLHSLRVLLEPEGVPAGSVLQLSLDNVSLGPSVQTDVSEFLAALREAKATIVPALRRVALEKMLALYGGPLLSGYYSDWIESEGGRLEDTFVISAKVLIGLLEEAGELDSALDVARQAVTLAPTREEALREMLRLSLKNGQHELALREFEAWQKEANKRGAIIGAATLELLRIARNLAAPAKESPLVPLQAPVQKGAPPVPRRPMGRSLPGQWTNFFGRETELEALCEWLSDPGIRLITLSGPGGGGKTRLALELARQIVKSPDVGDNVYFSLVEWVPLADLPDANLIPGAILDALKAARGVEDIDDLITALRAGLDESPSARLLLVFDNFEHLCDDGAPLVRALLDGVPELVCLVTSRRRLGFMGEREWPLQTLETPTSELSSGKNWVGFETLAPSSVRLFIDRARLARPDFALTAANADAVAQLCARLDGLPLTLELAAARIALFSPSQILAGLDHQLEKHQAENDGLGVEISDSLEVGSMMSPTSLDWTNQDRAAPPRHRSLRAAIAWSERQLPPAAARFWTRLSVFRGGWTLDAAAFVCEEPDAAPMVLSLRDVSLISLNTQGELPRGNQLEALREYAAEGLTDGERDTVVSRHARYFLNWAETVAPQLSGARAARYLARFEDERDNLRVALEWHLRNDVEGALRLVSALWWTWELRSRVAEGRAALARALEAARIAFPHLETEEEERETDEAELAREQRLVLLVAQARNGAGKLATVAADFDSARVHLESALVLFRRLHDDAGVADCLYSLGYMRLRSGDLEGARGLCDESIAIYRALGERSALCDALYNRALVALYESDFETVRTLNAERLIIHRASGETRGVAISLENLGLAALFSGEIEAARKYLEEALSLFENMQEWPSVLRVLWGLGHSLRAAGNTELARAAFSRALQLSREHQSLWTWPYLIEAFASLAAEASDAPRAVRLLAGAALMRETHHEPLPNPMFRQEIENAVAALQEALGDAVFESEWQLGRAMTRDDLVTFALDEDGGEDGAAL